MVYHLTTDTGKRLNIEANDAGEACGLGLRKAKGARITECFSGNTEGRITYEIPRHDPYVKKIKTKKPVQTQLFS